MRKFENAVKVRFARKRIHQIAQKDEALVNS